MKNNIKILIDLMKVAKLQNVGMSLTSKQAGRIFKELKRLNKTNARATQRIKQLEKVKSNLASKVNKLEEHHEVDRFFKQNQKIEELKNWLDDKEQELSDIKKTVLPLKNEIRDLNEIIGFNPRCIEIRDLIAKNKNQAKTIDALTRENTRLEQLIDFGNSPSFSERVQKLQYDIEINQYQYQSRIDQLEKERKELTEANEKLKEKLTRTIDITASVDLSSIFRDGL